MCLDYAHEIWDLIAPVNYLSLNPSDWLEMLIVKSWSSKTTCKYQVQMWSHTWPSHFPQMSDPEIMEPLHSDCRCPLFSGFCLFFSCCSCKPQQTIYLLPDLTYQSLQSLLSCTFKDSFLLLSVFVWVHASCTVPTETEKGLVLDLLQLE